MSAPEPLATALVSTWSSERYLRGCLDDLLGQSIGDRLEIFVIDACSPEREAEIVRSYQRDHANIRYVCAPSREGTSASFNRGTALARGRYLTTANTDDRHHPEFFARMIAALDANPQFGIAYADSLITRRDNETWRDHTATTKFAWPDYTPATALSCCLFGAQPVWRREVHATVGPWDENRRHANDQDMFLRIARRCGAVHVNAPLGLFLQRPDSVAGSGNREATLREVLEVFREHRTSWALDEVFPALRADDSPAAQAAAWIELGNLAALGPYTDAELALSCWQRAIALPGIGAAAQAVFANNTGCVLAGAGQLQAAERAFVLCRAHALAEANRARIAAATRIGTLPRLGELSFATCDHAVVRASRRARGLAFDDGGRPVWTPFTEQVPWDVFDGPNGVPWTPRDVVAAPGAACCSTR